MSLSSGTGGLSAAALTQGLQHLQQLQLTELTERYTMFCHTAVSVPPNTLTALNVLNMYDSEGLDPACLAGMHHLQDLAKADTSLLGGQAGMALPALAEMLQHMSAMQQLEKLVLCNALDDAAPTGAAYWAFTASSRLR